jgi:hypothetical protein
MSGGLRPCRRAGAGGVVGLALIVKVASAAAADPVSDEVLASRVDELNRSAVHQMQAKRFDAGRKHLFEAARMARERGGVQGDALLARTHLHLGALEIRAGAQAANARAYFIRALCRDPNVRPGGPLAAHADVVRAFAAVKSEYRAPRRCPVAQDPGEPDVPASINALDCRFKDEVLGATDFVVRCAANPRRGVDGARLHYDSRATYAFKAIEMQRTARGWWTATIPKEDVAGGSLWFYVEGTTGGKIVVADRSSGSPHIVVVVPPDLCSCD